MHLCLLALISKTESEKKRGRRKTLRQSTILPTESVTRLIGNYIYL